MENAEPAVPLNQRHGSEHGESRSAQQRTHAHGGRVRRRRIDVRHPGGARDRDLAAAGLGPGVYHPGPGPVEDDDVASLLHWSTAFPYKTD